MLCFIFWGRIVELEQARVPGSIKFGEDFEFDSRACRLRRSGRVLKLGAHSHGNSRRPG